MSLNSHGARPEPHSAPDSESFSGPSPGLLALALRKHTAHIRAQLTEVARPVPIALYLDGVPDTRQIQGAAALRHDGMLRFVIDEIDGRDLSVPICVDVAAPAPALVVEGSIVGRGGIMWTRAVPGHAAETVALDAVGRDVTSRVDTVEYPWMMTCECGRVRFAKRNSVHQIIACRVCTKRRQRRYRTQWQRQKRRA